MTGRRGGFLLIGCVLVTACGSGSASPPTSTSTSRTDPSPRTSVSPPSATPDPGGGITDIVAAGARAIRQGGKADWVALAGGSAWVTIDGGIQQMDGTTGAKGALVPVGAICTAMDTGPDGLWAADCEHGTVVRVDPHTATVAATYPVVDGTIAEEGSVGVGEGGVWVATSIPSLVRIDPATGTAKAFPLPAQGAGVRAGLGSVWVTVPDSGDLLRIDPDDGSVTSTIKVGPGARFLTIGGDAVWVMNNGDGTVSRVAADGAVTTTQASTVGINGGDIAYGGGFVWPRISAGLVVKLDGTTGELIATYGPPSGSGSVAADDTAAWISAHDVNFVWRLPLE